MELQRVNKIMKTLLFTHGTNLMTIEVQIILSLVFIITKTSQLERTFKKMELIVDPNRYIKQFKTLAVVCKLGNDFKCYDWKKNCKEVVKPVSRWYFPFEKSKRMIISRSKHNNSLVRGESFYSSDLVKQKLVTKPGLTALDIEQ